MTGMGLRGGEEVESGRERTGMSEAAIVLTSLPRVRSFWLGTVRR